MITSFRTLSQCAKTFFINIFLCILHSANEEETRSPRLSELLFWRSYTVKNDRHSICISKFLQQMNKQLLKVHALSVDRFILFIFILFFFFMGEGAIPHPASLIPLPPSPLPLSFLVRLMCSSPPLEK